MKRKMLLAVCLVALLVCLFAISVSAAEPDYNGETVILNDGTECPIWDTDGNGLIWYIVSSTYDESTKVTTYVYDWIAATDSRVTYKNTYDKANQLAGGGLSITTDSGTYASSTLVVANLKKDVKITEGKLIGNLVDYFSKTFTGHTNLQYVYFPVYTTSIGAEVFKNCSNLKYVNLQELTEITALGSQAFNGCPKLFENTAFDFTGFTKLTKVDTNAFSTTLVTELTFPESLTNLGGSVFQSCSQLTKITFKGTLTTCGAGSSGAGSMFSGCKKLVSVEGFNGFSGGFIKDIPGSMFKECYVLNNVTGLIENGVLTLPDGCKGIGTFAFNECDAITAIIFPASIATIYQQGFSYMDNVKLLDFSAKDKAVREAIANGESYTSLTLNNCGHFRAMKSLVAVSLPYGIKEINNRAFADCTNLTAVYLPDSVETLNNNGNGQGCFCNSPKLYFVHDSFEVGQCIGENGTIDLTKLVLPEKPSVYFMPKYLKKFTGHLYGNDTYGNATVFMNCASINDVIVFPETFTSMAVMRAFQGIGTQDSPKTVVFLGDMEEFVIPRYCRYVNYIFANPNDTTFADLGIKRTSDMPDDKGSSAYFCATGKWYDLTAKGRVGSGTDPNNADNIAKMNECINAFLSTEQELDKHISNPNAAQVQTPATCVTNAFGVNFCFCGANMGENEILGTALGHSFTVDLGIHYVNYMTDSYYSFGCARCDEVKQGEKAFGAIFNYYGYSCTEEAIDGKYSMSQFYGVNNEALEAYKSYTGKNFAYGLVASGSANPLSIVEGELAVADKAFIKDSATFAHNFFGIKINGMTEENLNTAIVFCAYVVDGDKVYYLDNDTTTKAVAGVTFENVLVIVNTPTVKEDAE